MKKALITLAAVFFSTAFFMAAPGSGSGGFAYAQPGCDMVDNESTITDELKKSPDYLVAKLENNDLITFWEKMRESGLLNGNVPEIDKIYLLKSENHPQLLYIAFLKEGCIIDFKFTMKNIVEGFLP